MTDRQIAQAALAVATLALVLGIGHAVLRVPPAHQGFTRRRRRR